MAKFCTTCGENLEENQCQCVKEEIVAEKVAFKEVENGDTVSVNVDVNKIVNEGITGVVVSKNIITKMIKAPVSTFIDVIKEPNLTVGITFILTYALLWSLIVFSFAKNIADQTGGILYSLLYEFGLGDMVGMLSNTMRASKIFSFVFIGIVIQGAVIVGLLVLANSMFKGKSSYQSITTMVGLTFAPSIIFTVAAFVVSFISFNLAVGMLIIGQIISMFLLFLGTKEILDINDDNAAYVVPLVYLINWVISFMYIKRGMMSAARGLMNPFMNMW